MIPPFSPNSNDPLALASRLQSQASNPYESAWVDASAGSGKTKVLVDRVLRLLLSGVAPQRILCITFTKAAAANMALRLSGTLGRWATLPYQDLCAELKKLLDDVPEEETVSLARRLFAQTLDAPGGLQFQTIHSFCQSLLARFPVEAGVPVGFTVLDDRQSHYLLDQSRRALVSKVSAEPEGDLAQALTLLLEVFGAEKFAEIEKQIISARSTLEPLFALGPLPVLSKLDELLSIREGESREALLDQYCEDSSINLPMLRQTAQALLQDSKSNVDTGEIMARWLAFSPAERAENIDSWISIFFKKDGEPRKAIVTKKFAEAHPDFAEAMDIEAESALRLANRLRDFDTHSTSRAMILYAATLIGHYHTHKQLQLALDFDDLIARSAKLLQDHASAWVLFKLDGGLDHVLVDEAQDTNPLQWQLLEKLTGDFFSGESAHNPNPARSFFAVGDFKQSIYSFQGAEPAAFVEARERLASRLSQIDRRLNKLVFSVSFRSTEAVLSAVDAVFTTAPAREGLGEYAHHIARNNAVPGRVDFWPIAPADAKQESEAYPLPELHSGRAHPSIRAAKVIAQQIRQWVESGEMLPARGRPLRYGDILVLVSKRGSFVPELVRACKQAGVPVSGADRMKLTEQLAVEDLLAYLNFLLLPEDDLTLATVLKGPLMGLTEDDLFALAYGRGKLSLWQRLGRMEKYRPYAAWLAEGLNQADRQTPYTLLANLLARPCPADNESGRRAMLHRLGPEAEDPLDELLSAALTYEQAEVPSLQGFVAWMQADDSEVKREMENAGGVVRIMTVHGAKGLEAPVVILASSLDAPQNRDTLLIAKDQPPLLPPSSARAADVAVARKAELHRAMMEEYHRLLYVALTRAEDWLVVASWDNFRPKKNGPDLTKGEAWPQLLWQSLSPLAETHLFDFTRFDLGWAGEGLRYERGAEALRQEKPQDIAQTISPPALPAWVSRAPVAEPTPSRPLTPSTPEEEPPVLSPLEGDDTARKYHRGLLIHRLLQTLPELPREMQREAGLNWLKPQIANAARLIDEVLAVMHSPEAEILFGPHSRAEVPISARLGARVLSGQIDRLAVTHDSVWLVDYKTGRQPPTSADSIPESYLRQLALYRAALAPLYPGKIIKPVLLWTYGPIFMPVNATQLDAFAPAP